jgi:hypothetical protein
MDRERKEDREKSRTTRDQVMEEEAFHATRCEWREEERTEGQVEINQGTGSERKHDGNRRMQVVQNLKNGKGKGRTKVEDAKKKREQGLLRWDEAGPSRWHGEQRNEKLETA